MTQPGREELRPHLRDERPPDDSIVIVRGGPSTLAKLAMHAVGRKTPTSSIASHYRESLYFVRWTTSDRHPSMACCAALPHITSSTFRMRAGCESPGSSCCLPSAVRTTRSGSRATTGPSLPAWSTPSGLPRPTSIIDDKSPKEEVAWSASTSPAISWTRMRPVTCGLSYATRVTRRSSSREPSSWSATPGREQAVAEVVDIVDKSADRVVHLLPGLLRGLPGGHPASGHIGLNSPVIHNFDHHDPGRRHPARRVRCTEKIIGRRPAGAAHRRIPLPGSHHPAGRGFRAESNTRR